MTLSLAIATYNEEQNIIECIESCRGLVDEIVVVDGCSTDTTGELALKAGARVIRTQNVPMFHINKQKAMDACTGEWILQLDADERVTPELASEIKKIISMSDEEITRYQENLKEKKLFERHQRLVFNLKLETYNLENKQNHCHSGPDPESIQSGSHVGARDDTKRGNDEYPISNLQSPTNSFNAFFIPRLNYFLGGYLRSGGVYPDGVIRLIRKGKAHLPCKDVHELMEVTGKTGWLAHPLIHKDSPTFKRYLERNSRYIDHLVKDLSCNTQHVTQNIKNNNIKTLHVTCYMLHVGIDWIIIKPTYTFFSLLVRHKGILDGWRGVIFAFFSALRFPRAYVRFLFS